MKISISGRKVWGQFKKKTRQLFTKYRQKKLRHKLKGASTDNIPEKFGANLKKNSAIVYKISSKKT
jgi:hypothetical protein